MSRHTMRWLVLGVIVVGVIAWAAASEGSDHSFLRAFLRNVLRVF